MVILKHAFGQRGRNKIKKKTVIQCVEEKYKSSYINALFDSRQMTVRYS